MRPCHMLFQISCAAMHFAVMLCVPCLTMIKGIHILSGKGPDRLQMLQSDRWVLQGVSKGFVNCVYNHGGDYSQNKGIMIFWLLFWAAQQFWISGFPALMGYAMFPQCFRTIDIVIILSLATGSSLVTLIGAPLGHHDLNNTLLVILPCAFTHQSISVPDQCWFYVNAVLLAVHGHM